MHTEHQTFDSRSFDDIVSAVIARLEAGRELLHDAPPAACDGMNAILDDATAKLDYLFKLSTKFDWPNGQTADDEGSRPVTDKQRTARLADATDEADGGIRELLAALEMADGCDVDSDTVRHAVRGFIKLARSAHEPARKAARMAAELHERTHRDRAA